KTNLQDREQLRFLLLGVKTVFLTPQLEQNQLSLIPNDRVRKHILSLNHAIAMAKLVVVSKSRAGLSHPLGKNWVTIGRSPGNAFQIVESSISGQHCEVLLRGNELLVRDMRSTNGTFIKEKMVTEGVLRKGEVLRLGEIELRLEV